MDYKKYDEFVNDALMCLYGIGKTSSEIRFENFDEHNTGHLMLYNVAQIAQTVFGYSIGMKATCFHFWKIKRKLKTKNIIRYKKKQICNLNPDEIIQQLETHYNEAGLAGKIYGEYYAK